MAVLSGGDKLVEALREIAQHAQRDGVLKVGFLQGGRYPDGTSIPLVAAVNEFGRLVRSKDGNYYQLPRPYFRNMIAKESPGWPAEMAAQLKATNYDVAKTMLRMGALIKGQLQESIRDLTDPPLAPSTIRRKGFSKPLIDKSVMINSVAYEYDEN